MALAWKEQVYRVWISGSDAALCAQVWISENSRSTSGLRRVHQSQRISGEIKRGSANSECGP